MTTPQYYPPPPPAFSPPPPASPKGSRTWVWVVGIIAVLMFSAFGACVVGVAKAVDETATTTTTTTTAVEAVAADEPVTTTVAPTTTAPPEDIVDAQAANARRSAESYLDLTGFSRSGLIHQLEFEGYPTESATVAVDSIGVDWMEQAVRSAESYLDLTGFSESGLIDQLEFEGYTAEQAQHGARTALGG